MSLTVGALGRGGTSASFHARGTLHSEKDVFRMSAIGAAKISAYSLNAQFGRSSGPPARAELISRSNQAIKLSLTFLPDGEVACQVANCVNLVIILQVFPDDGEPMLINALV